MGLIELDIIYLEELINMKNVEIPPYQRPYLWGKESVNILFNDIYSAFKKNMKEYRLGSVILHKKKEENKYHIVDGQQRLTTIAILLYCLDKKDFLMDSKYSPLSNKAILNNYTILKQRVKDLGDEREKYREYMLYKCSFVKIVTDSQQEAFQFFDSQNSRGKDLAPHDLLKAYHLREMNDMDSKKDIINKWEDIKQDELETLFSTYLYPVTQWYRCRDGLYYGKKDIGQFKGINKKNNSNYAIYHKASNLFLEQFNRTGNNELLNTGELNQFQLTQPVIAGSRFFAYTIHYKKLLDEVKNKLEKYHKNKAEIPNSRTGDRYVKELYECALLFFADKFGLDSLKDSVFRVIYAWCYFLRLKMYNVQKTTINSYACGKHETTNININIFSYINDSCLEPDDLNTLIIPKQQIDERLENNKKKYEAIYNKIYKDNGWEENGK